MLDKSIMVLHASSRRKLAEFEHLDTITVWIRRGRDASPNMSYQSPESEVALDDPMSTAPQTYIKGPYFRGYLQREVANVKFTRFERARIIGARALQISMGSPILIDIPESMIDPIEVSILEFNSGVIPMTVKRDA
jgi:DNA-directed RNA polymerase subunit K